LIFFKKAKNKEIKDIQQVETKRVGLSIYSNIDSFQDSLKAVDVPAFCNQQLIHTFATSKPLLFCSVLKIYCSKQFRRKQKIPTKIQIDRRKSSLQRAKLPMLNLLTKDKKNSF
jgi:hypothetical protein